MQGNAEVRKRFEVSTRTADTLLGIMMKLRDEADKYWPRLSEKITLIGMIVTQKDYTKQLPEDWREYVMAFSRMRVQRAFAYLGDLVFRTEEDALGNYRDWRAQVKLMHEAIEQERAFTRMCEDWLESQKEWRYRNG